MLVAPLSPSPLCALVLVPSPPPWCAPPRRLSSVPAPGLLLPVFRVLVSLLDYSSPRRPCLFRGRSSGAGLPPWCLPPCRARLRPLPPLPRVVASRPSPALPLSAFWLAWLSPSSAPRPPLFPPAFRFLFAFLSDPRPLSASGGCPSLLLFLPSFSAPPCFFALVVLLLLPVLAPVAVSLSRLLCRFFLVGIFPPAPCASWRPSPPVRVIPYLFPSFFLFLFPPLSSSARVAAAPRPPRLPRLFLFLPGCLSRYPFLLLLFPGVPLPSPGWPPPRSSCLVWSWPSPRGSVRGLAPAGRAPSPLSCLYSSLLLCSASFCSLSLLLSVARVLPALGCCVRRLCLRRALPRLYLVASEGSRPVFPGAPPCAVLLTPWRSFLVFRAVASALPSFLFGIAFPSVLLPSRAAPLCCSPRFRSPVFARFFPPFSLLSARRPFVGRGAVAWALPPPRVASGLVPRLVPPPPPSLYRSLRLLSVSASPSGYCGLLGVRFFCSSLFPPCGRPPPSP